VTPSSAHQRVALARREYTAAIAGAAHRINADLAATPDVIAALEPSLRKGSHGLLGRVRSRLAAAELLVARDLRRTVFLAIGHRFAMALLPQAIESLSGLESSGLEPTLPTGDPGSLMGARGRVFHGLQASFIATLCPLLAIARDRMYREWSDNEHDVVRTEVRRLSLAVSECARRTYREEYGEAWTAPLPSGELYQIRDERPYRSRTLTFLAEHLNPDLDESLRGSELGQAEHLAVALTDLYGTLAAAGCPVRARAAVCLAHLPLLSSLAALRDEIADRLVFGPDHRPLYRVERVESWEPSRGAAGEPAAWRVRALRAPMNARLAQRPGRCPAAAALNPTVPGHLALVDAFHDALAAAGGAASPDDSRRTAVSAAEVSSAYAVGVMGRLIRAVDR
jgi:hypothetical protein